MRRLAPGVLLVFLVLLFLLPIGAQAAPAIHAHRGGPVLAGVPAFPEETMPAFRNAAREGYWLELDAKLTSDGVPVVFHDATLDRVAGRPGRVDQLSWTDLATVRVGGAAAVPRLDEILAAWPQVRFNIDVKAGSGVAPTVETVTRAGAGDRVLLASFSDARLARLRTLAGPKVATSLGMRGVARLRVASLTGQRLTLPTSVVAAQVPVRYGRLPVVDRRFVRYAHKLGLQVHVWTIDDPAEMHGLLDLGVDGIMTDRVEVLREVYLSRGVWHDEGAQ
jgi:glycerophosphoryl diester phosphodiesterase